MYQDIIGVLGGMGSYATLHFFQELLDAFPAEKEWDRPRILIDNRCTMPSRVLAILDGTKRSQLVDELCDSVTSLLHAGATKIVLACNTSHCFLPDIYQAVPDARGRILSIIDACCLELADAHEKKVSLIASEGTIQSGVFRQALEPYGISVTVPVAEQYLKQRELIEAVKQNKITDKVLYAFVQMIRSFSGDALILGCTEFPVLFSRLPEDALSGIRVYDPLKSAVKVLQAVCK